jgi:hypothetical protein
MVWSITRPAELSGSGKSQWVDCNDRGWEADHRELDLRPPQRRGGPRPGSAAATREVVYVRNQEGDAASVGYGAHARGVGICTGQCADLAGRPRRTTRKRGPCARGSAARDCGGGRSVSVPAPLEKGPPRRRLCLQARTPHPADHLPSVVALQAFSGRAGLDVHAAGLGLSRSSRSHSSGSPTSRSHAPSNRTGNADRPRLREDLGGGVRKSVALLPR